MFLRRLELVGFKSFANRTVLDLDPGIVVVVGPNGSGKSNVADAVRWVLGEQSMRAVRGKKSEDVIFAGSATRQPVGMAEVSLTLDNSDGRAPLAYNEVRITRRLYRSGESEYLLNGSRVRLKDIVEVLTHAGMGSESYSVIGQGAVDELLLQRPEERRQAFESAADIRRYQIKLAETRGRLESTQQNLTRCRDVVAELEPHLRRLRTQSERAERARQLQAELWNLATRWFRRRVAEATAELRQAEEAFGAAEVRRQELESLVAEQEERWQDLETHAAETEAQLQRLRPLVDALRAQRAQLERDLAVTEERIRQAARQSTRDAGEREELQARLSELEVDLAAANQNRASLEERLADERTRVAAMRASLQQQERELARLEAEQADEERTRGRLLSERAEMERRRSVLEVKAETLRQEIENASGARAELEQAARELAENIELELREIASLEQHAAAARQERERLARQQRELAARRADLQRANMDAERVVARLEAARQQLAPTPVRAGPQGLPGDVSALSDRIVGILGEQLYISAEHERAVGAALEHLSAALVVRSREDQQHLGASLVGADGRWLLLSSVPPAHVDVAAFKHAVRERVPPELEVCFADELVECEAPLEPLIRTLLGRSLVVADEHLFAAAALLEESAELRAPWQVVSLSGNCLRSSGEWVLGLGGQTDAALSRERERRRVSAELSEARERLTALSAEAEEVGRAALEAEQQDRASAARASELHSMHAERRARMEALKSEARRREQALAQQRSRLDGVRDELARLEQQGQSAGLAQAERERELQELERRRDDMRVRLQEMRQQAQAQRSALSTAQTDLAVRETHLRSVAELEQRLAAETARARDQRERLSREQTQVSSTLDQQQSALEERRARLRMVEDELGPLSAALEACEADRRVRAADRHALEEAMMASRRESRAADEAHEAATLGVERARDELARLRREAGEALLQDELVEEDEWPTQLRMVLEPSLGAPTVEDEPIPDMAAARRRITALQRELRAAGSVNQGVLEEYQEMSERCEFLQVQSRDLSAASAELQQAIAELEQIMGARFAETFQRVNEYFQHTFSILFGGGQAELVLTRPENVLETGIDIVAKPPGKRLQGLVTLSGGERALTSVALLFALLRVNPAPFVLLDEVDAALDEANVQRFARMLQDYSSDIQFLVITHNRATMEIANALFGVSMEAGGVSKVLSVRLGEANGSTASAGGAR